MCLTPCSIGEYWGHDTIRYWHIAMVHIHNLGILTDLVVDSRQVYAKWNQRLFNERMYLAYKAGRLEKDPSEGWYRGEIGFFDYYIVSSCFPMPLRIWLLPCL
jgi:hypothetical protein